VSKAAYIVIIVEIIGDQDKINGRKALKIN